MSTVEKLTRDWTAAGIAKGDLVLIHSSLRRVLSENKTTPEDILQSLLNAVGDEGTLLLPLFNFDFCKATPFDIRTTPSHMGALTEAARKYPNAVRTGHPVYSFAAIGKQADKFKNVNNKSGYGADSPFAMLHRMNGKIAVIDLPDQNSMTFYHYVEEQHQVPYRFLKTFMADYTDESGYTETKPYQIYVRDFDKKVETNVGEMEKILWDSGIYKGNQTGMRTANAAEIYTAVSDIITSGKAENILYKVGK